MNALKRIAWVFAVSAAMLLAAGTPALALAGQVTQISILNNSNIVHFVIEGYGAAGTPGCNTTGRFAIDTSTASGKDIYALLLSARAAGWRLQPHMAGTCRVWSDSADLSHINIDNS